MTGTILGTITDTSGAVDARHHRDADQHRHRAGRASSSTDSAGEYTAPSLPTGTYTVTAELPGFKTATLPDIELGVDQRLRFNVRLEVGAVSRP